jgi:subfamily B ATP-binding cassette protein MsbA
MLLGSVDTTVPRSRLASLRRLLGYLEPFVTPFCLGLCGAALFAACQSGFLWFLKAILDETFFDQDRDRLAWVPIAIVALFAVRGLGDFIQTYFMSLVGRGVVGRLRSQLFGRLMYLPLAYYDGATAATLLSRLLFNTEQVAQASTDSIICVVRESLIIVGSLVYLFLVNAYLASIAVIAAPLISVLMRQVNRYFRRYGLRIQASMSDLTHVAQEAIEAPRAIRTCNAQQHQIARFEVANQRHRHACMRAALTRALSNPIVQMIAAISLAIVMKLAIGEALAHRLTPGEFVSFIGALASIAQPLRNLVNVASPIQQGIAAAESLFEIIDEPAEPNLGSCTVRRALGRVEYRGVGFGYANQRGAVVEQISFIAEPGEVIAIVGESGSGKSTLMNLLPRLYQATSGAVFLDGLNIAEYELASLRNQIAVVSQDIVLFNDTLQNNICFGVAAAEAEIERAAATALVLDFARELPNGLQTLVGDRGGLLSGGQRQRIAIARALLKDAPILILDEATGALDAQTERCVQAGIEALMQHRTTFVIAHRLATIEKADRILVMHAGCIVEAGTHSELMARNGRYAVLYRHQVADA